MKIFLEKYPKAVNDIKWIGGISFLITFILFFLFTTGIILEDFFGTTSIVEIFEIIGCSLACLLIYFIAPPILFLPAEIIIFHIFENTQSEMWRIAWCAFLIPFCNMVYFALDCLYTYKILGHFNIDASFSKIIGLYMLVFVLPTISLATMCIPKNKLYYKQQILKCLALMMFFGWGLVFLCFKLVEITEKIIMFHS